MALLNMEGLYFIFKWLHVFFGILWIGHLYYLNFSQTPFMAVADGPTKSGVQQKLFPEVFFWFRWGAMFTFITGWLMIGMRAHTSPGIFSSSWGVSLLTGGLMGTVMWYNVWFVIWPIQKQVIQNATDVAAGKPANAGLAALLPKAALASRTNATLSIALIFFMLLGRSVPFAVNNATPYWIGFAILIGAFELNVFKGKIGPLATVRGFVHVGTALTVVLYVMAEFLTK